MDPLRPSTQTPKRRPGRPTFTTPRRSIRITLPEPLEDTLTLITLNPLTGDPTLGLKGDLIEALLLDFLKEFKRNRGEVISPRATALLKSHIGDNPL